MSTISSTYDDLRFSPDQIYFSDAELKSIAQEFFGNTVPEQLTSRDRAFLQAALFVAVDKSEKASFVFSIFRAFVSAAPSQSIKKLMTKLASSAAKYAFSAYIDDDPKYSPAGRAGVQYSMFATEWRVRVGTGDESMLSNFQRY